MSKAIDFYQDLDNREYALSKALEEFNLELEDWQTVPEAVLRRRDEILVDMKRYKEEYKL